MADLQVDAALSLPRGFQFTQSKLQDFEDCPRRFYLKYILNQQWPSPLIEPQADFENAMQRGQRFHLMVERHQLGIPDEALLRNADSTLQDWFRRYQDILKRLGEFERAWPEISLSTTLDSRPLLAKFDLIGRQKDTLFAVDWKTGRLPSESRLSRRMQTIVYGYILFTEAVRLVTTPIANYVLIYAGIVDGEIRTFNINQQSADEYKSRIQSVIAAIDSSDFPKVPDERPCRFCYYRGLCERGTSPTISDITAEDLDNYWRLDDTLPLDTSAVEF